MKMFHPLVLIALAGLTLRSTAVPVAQDTGADVTEEPIADPDPAGAAVSSFNFGVDAF